MGNPIKLKIMEKFSYDKNGLGLAEMGFLAVNFPTIFDTATKADTEADILNIARKAIEAIQAGLVENE